MSDTAGDRTEQATPKRIEKAREDGMVLRAHSLAGVAVLIAGSFVLVVGGGKLINLLELSLRTGLSPGLGPMREPAHIGDAVMAILKPGMSLLVPYLLLMMAVAFLTDLLVGGWSFSFKALLPDFSRLSPAKGLGRLFSQAALAEIVKALLKTVVVCVVAYWLVEARLDSFVHIAAETWPFAARHTAGLTMNIFLVLAGALATVTILEVPYQVWQYRDQLKMSRQEIKDERREMDGSPETRRRIRGIQQKLARARMIVAVESADVVITNPEHYSAALKYDAQRMLAPRLVAKGSGLIALRIREVAAEHGVPIVEAPPLTRAINKYVELGGEIPTGLYGAVAEVLAYVYGLKAARDMGRPPPPNLPGGDRFQPPAEYDV
ncbi:MAG TPA: flagellar biosynthesis protein FlhB [Stellaceae bacterium]